MRSILVLVVLFASSWAKVQFLSENFIKTINSKQSTWKAGRNFPEDTPLEVLERLNGDRTEEFEVPHIPHKAVIAQEIPENFDGRTNWPDCESLNTIRDQGNCGSCWAFATAEAMTDRLCIASNGNTKFEFSPEDVLSCCTTCGYGCQGGNTVSAWTYFLNYGIVSGGDYNTDKGCKPYSASAFLDNTTPECYDECTNDGFTGSYSSDKRFGSSQFHISSRNVEEIQTEIMTNGPVTASYYVYQDFYNYKSGVYQHLEGEYSGSHAVKVIGWGVEEGTPYWLIANSWGTSWGDLGGFFKILRGSNECNIENRIVGGQPKV